MEPSEQSRAKIALGKADKVVHLTVSAAHRWARDVMRQVDEDDAFYVAGDSIFTDVLLIIALLLAFVIIFLLGYSFGSRCGRRAVDNAAKAVICDGGCQKRFSADGGEQSAAKTVAAKQQIADEDAEKQSADDDKDSTA